MPAISDAVVDIWREDGTMVVADKPRGMPVHPPDQVASNTLINALLGCNRWLADMETSLEPGVIYHLNPYDRGLVVAAKNEEAAQTLRESYRANQWTFSYRVRVSTARDTTDDARIDVVDRRIYEDGTTVLDINTPVGDTDVLRQTWLGVDDAASAYFCLYRLEVPIDTGRVTVALGERMRIPEIELYTVPP